MSPLPAMAVLLPLFSALVLFFWAKPSPLRSGFSVGFSVAQALLCWWLALQTRHGEILTCMAGNWSPPYGIALVVDPLSAVMMALASSVAATAVLFSHYEMPAARQHPLRMPLVHTMMMGANLAFATGDLFNLFVAFEITLVASYALMVIESDSWEIRHAVPYVAINLVGSALFLTAAGLVYSLFGTLNFADIIVRSGSLVGDPRMTFLVIILCLAFSIKAGVVPLHHWLPNSYPTLPPACAALFGGLLTKIGVYAILRCLGTVFPPAFPGVYEALGWLAAVTAVVGGLGAVSRDRIRDILSFHIIGQIGLMLLPAALMTRGGFTAAILILWHNMVVKSSLFLIGGVVLAIHGTDRLSKIGGLLRASPWLAGLFAIQAFSLAGLPPLSGFWGKLLALEAGITRYEYGWVAAGMIGGVLTLISMVKIWNSAFAAASVEPAPTTTDTRLWKMAATISILCVLTLGMTVLAGPMVKLSRVAAAGVMDRTGYAESVLELVGKDRLGGGMP